MLAATEPQLWRDVPVNQVMNAHPHDTCSSAGPRQREIKQADQPLAARLSRVGMPLGEARLAERREALSIRSVGRKKFEIYPEALVSCLGESWLFT